MRCGWYYLLSKLGKPFAIPLLFWCCIPTSGLTYCYSLEHMCDTQNAQDGQRL